MKELARLGVESPKIPIVANVSGEFYPMGPNVGAEMIEILGRQIASPVQFVKGLETLYEAGARVFVEVGPKSALARFADDVLGEQARHAVLVHQPSEDRRRAGVQCGAHRALCKWSRCATK